MWDDGIVFADDAFDSLGSPATSTMNAFLGKPPLPHTALGELLVAVQFTPFCDPI